jgi:hypothetical protein
MTPILGQHYREPWAVIWRNALLDTRQPSYHHPKMAAEKSNVRGPSVSTAGARQENDLRFQSLTIRQRMTKALQLGRRGRVMQRRALAGKLRVSDES